jgi:hypothetical protein
MRDRCPVAQAGQVFLALVGWRPSPGCTGSASPCACLTSRLESLKLEKPFQGPNLGYFQPTVPASERQGAAQHWDLHKQAPRLSALGSLTANGPLHQMGGSPSCTRVLLYIVRLALSRCWIPHPTARLLGDSCACRKPMLNN